MDSREREYWKRYYGQMVGYTVTAVKVEEDGTPVLTIMNGKDGLEVGIMCDPEGNGPGFIDSLPRVKAVAS